MTKLLHIFLLSGCCFLMPDAEAQKWTVGLYSQAHFPQHEYKETYSKTGVGMGLDALYTPEEEGLLSVGGEAGILFLRTARRRVDPYNLGWGNTHQLIASNNIVTLGAKARLNFIRDPEKMVRVYLEAKLGTNAFIRSVELQQLTTTETEASVSRTKWGLYGGPAAGFSVAIGENRKIHVFAQAAYLWGSQTTYYSNPRINEADKPVFTANRSRTDMIFAQAGFRFNLEDS